MTWRVRMPFCVLFAIAVSACGSASSSDASKNDGGSRDGGAVDQDGTSDQDATNGQDAGGGGIADAGGDDGAIACPGAIDLDQAGVRTGTSPTTSYVGSNADASVRGPFANPSCEAMNGFAGHQVLYTYTPRDTKRLLISTDFADTTFDTVVWVLADCGMHPKELACNNDVIPGFDLFSTVTASATANVPVTIVVAGHGATSTQTATGAFHLAVTEQTKVGEGMPCDPSGIADYCSGPTTCIAPAGGGQSTCIRDGTQGGACRVNPPFCDMNLGCTADPLSPAARCVPIIADGGMCDPTRRMNICTIGEVCITNQSGSVCKMEQYTESRILPVFVDACTIGTHVTLVPGPLSTDARDDGHASAAIPLPFPFLVYGSPVTSIWPSTNGYAVFGDTAPTDATGTLDTIPTGAEAEPAVFAFWEDLILRAAPSSDVCWSVSGSAPHRRFVVEWKDAYDFAATQQLDVHLTFELALIESTNAIDFVYQTLSSAAGDETYVNGTSALIGLQSAGGGVSLQHAGTVTTTRALHFTP